MFDHARQVWDISLPHAEKMVLLVYAWNVGKESGLAWQRTSTTVAWLNLSRATVKRAKAKLIERGFLEAVEHNGYTAYKVHLPDELAHSDTALAHGEPLGAHSEPPPAHSETQIGYIQDGNSMKKEVRPTVAHPRFSAKSLVASAGEDGVSKVQKAQATGTRLHRAGRLFRDLMAEVHGIKVMSLTEKQRGQIKAFVKKTGDCEESLGVLEFIIKNWEGFRDYLNAVTGSKLKATTPQLGTLTMYASEALSYSAKPAIPDIHHIGVGQDTTPPASKAVGIDVYSETTISLEDLDD